MNLTLSILRETVMVGKEPTKNYCLLELETPSLTGQTRANLDLVMIIDKSGSMEGENKLVNVKKAAEQIVNLLGPNDRLGLIVFACQGAEVFSLAQINNKSLYIDKIRNLNSVSVGSSTVMSAGLKLAYEMLRKNGGKNLKRIILMTDGEVTEEVTNCIKFKPLCDEEAVQIRCVGVGSSWNMELLHELDWKHQPEYIQDGQVHQIPEKFAAEFQTLSNTYAYDASLNFNPVSGVEIIKCNRFHPAISIADRIAKTNSFQIGSLASGGKEYFLLQIVMPPRAAEGYYTLAQCYLEYTSAESNTRTGTSPQQIRVAYTNDPIRASMVNPDVQHYVKQLDAHTMVERATGLLNNGDVAMGTSILSKAARLTGDLGNQELQNKLTSVLNAVRKTGVLTPEQEKNIFYESRKTSILEKKE